MADLGTSTAPAQDRDVASDGHRVERRNTLPGGRAVVGALLITLSVIGVFAAWLSATAAPTTTWVVATSALSAGDQVTTDDVDVVAIDLPDEQAARAFTRIDEVVGMVAMAPMNGGDLVTRSVVRPAGDVADRSLFSFELPTAQALGGQVDPGDRVDVMATDDGRTGFVATDLEVIRGTIDGGVVTITLAVDDPGRLLALGNAVDLATVHLVMATPANGRADTTATDPFPVGDGADPTAPDDGPADPATPGTGPTPAATATPSGGE